MKRLIAACIICGLVVAVVPRIPAQDNPANGGIRVGLVIDARLINVSCEGNYTLTQVADGATAEIEPGNDYRVTAQGETIEFGGERFSSPVRLKAADGAERIRINGRRYRADILITAENGTLTAVNELGIEEYLYGILPTEASPAWAIESLKAQAVVSRTYALRNLKRHGRDGFDICTQTHCQVYGGLESEDERSNRAVDETRGEVLVYDGALAQTLFHASCGGYTENPNNVWNWENKAPSYLSGRADKYCAESPHNVWKNKIDARTIRDRLNRAGYRVGTIKKIKIAGHVRSGRVKNLKIYHSRGTLQIPAAKFRMAVDTWLVKSTFIKDIARRGSAFEFSGRGWGHGVGLCQWGAKVMAEKDKDYREILEFYYPGTTVERINE
jgi:stage II sporulation protein D